MVSSVSASGIITLTTDFGHKGPYVATMKGVMLRRFPDAKIIDLTHEVYVHWPVEAGFWLERAFRYFPEGTVHVAVVDPGVGTLRDIIVAEREGHMFLAPDNGLLGALLSDLDASPTYRLDLGRTGKFHFDPPSATFHGRDIFAPLAAELAARRCRPSEMGPRVHEIAPGWVDAPEVDGNRVQGVIITTDHFGNLISNIDEALVRRFDTPRVTIAGRELPVQRTYGERKPGEYLALINSFGVLEIARAEDNAAEGLGVGRGAPVVVKGD
ncbi:MAG: SAM-dependent chlorinase/fluorinase [Deltaproteobacteria bacterium]|nr:SAM-dependent chlorinase/fluorinase [Deltaproteobacteria bacterium]